MYNLEWQTEYVINNCKINLLFDFVGGKCKEKLKDQVFYSKIDEKK